MNLPLKIYKNVKETHAEETFEAAKHAVPYLTRCTKFKNKV